MGPSRPDLHESPAFRSSRLDWPDPENGPEIRMPSSANRSTFFLKRRPCLLEPDGHSLHSHSMAQVQCIVKPGNHFYYTYPITHLPLPTQSNQVFPHRAKIAANTPASAGTTRLPNQAG